MLVNQNHNCKDNDDELEENQNYGVSVPFTYTVPEEAQMQDNTPMKKNICYGASTQHMEIVSNESYGSMPEEQPIDNIIYYTM